MQKKNYKEKLINRKIKTPNKFLAFFVVKAFKHLAKKRNAEFVYKGNVKEYMGKQVILLSQHCSRDEYIYTLAGFPKTDLHVVIGYQNFFDKSVFSMLIELGAIAKYLYQPDATATKHMLRVIKNGESLALFPEGIQSTSGSTHPINPATMKFLLKCRLPIVLCTSHGSYLTRPRYSTTKRFGKMTFTYQLLFDKEDYTTMSPEEMYSKLLAEFKYNEFEYNREARIPFRGECENIDGLDNIIYKCPHCQSEFKMTVQKDTIRCSECGYEVRMDEYYDLHQVNLPIYFTDIDKWYKWQRQEVHKEILEPHFCIRADVRAYDINLEKLKKTPDLVGEGVLTITNHTITYKGTHKGAEKQLEFDIKNVPSLTFAPTDHTVEMYYGNDYFCFEPKKDKLHIVKWMLATEEIHNLYDEHWAKASKDVYDE